MLNPEIVIQQMLENMGDYLKINREILEKMKEIEKVPYERRLENYKRLINNS